MYNLKVPKYTFLPSITPFSESRQKATIASFSEIKMLGTFPGELISGSFLSLLGEIHR